MAYLKHFFSFIFILSGVVSLHAQTTDQALTSCLEEGKKFFSAREYPKASIQFEKCVAQNPSNVDAQLSLAGALLTQNKFKEAEEHFTQALKNMDRQSPYRAYTYSMLGDIALKQQKNEEALSMYSKSLEYNAANVNSLIGKGVIVEYKGDKKAAAECYRSALAVEPLNLIARKRLINLEPDYFTDDEILVALKQRYAVAPQTKELTDENRQLFRKIHLTEQRRGVDYLRNKFPQIPPDYVVTLNKDSDFSREILTLNGYKALQQQLANDAINTFQKVGVEPKEIFDLRDLKGAPVFDKEGLLTEAGFQVYIQALNNKKAFLRPNQEVPPTEDQLKKAQQAAERLQKDGYIEISPLEMKKLEEVTKCSRDTLKKDLGVYFLPITKSRNRFFVQTKEQTNPNKGVSYYYIAKERSKKDPSIKVPSNSLIESIQYFGNSTVCLDDGKLLYQ